MTAREFSITPHRSILARRAYAPAGIAILLVGLLAITLVVVDHPDRYRLLFALLAGGNLLILARAAPRLAVLVTFALLPFLGIARRLLIGSSGWTPHDPLLLVAPALAIYLLYRLFVVERRALAPDRLSRLVLALGFLILAQAFNPLSEASLLANTAGLLFIFVPLLWFFIGREIFDGRLTRQVQFMTILIAVVCSVYGLWQNQIGFPPWDQNWLAITEYTALNVGGELRSFGTFASSAEYAFYLSAAAIFGLAFLLHGKPLPALVAPLLATAVFLQASRGVIVLTVLSLVLLLALRTHRSLAVPAFAVGLAAVLGAYALVSPTLQETAQRTGNPFVEHQLSGLTKPLDPESSTAGIHWQAVRTGIETSLREPLGKGTAAITPATARFVSGGPPASTEVDISNVFVGIGLVGGFLFLAVIVYAFHRAIILYLATREAVVLALIGLLVICLGQWLNGAYYAFAPLLWSLVGWATAEFNERIASLRPQGQN